MQNIVLAIHIILAILLIGAVLMQRSEGGGLGIGGGGNAKTGSRGGLDGLGKATWYLAAGFIATSLTLTIMATQSTGTASILDSLVDSAPVSSEGAVDESNALPELPSDTPTE